MVNRLDVMSKNEIRKVYDIPDKPPLYFSTGIIIANILHARLRQKCSSLKCDLFRCNLISGESTITQTSPAYSKSGRIKVKYSFKEISRYLKFMFSQNCHLFGCFCNNSIYENGLKKIQLEAARIVTGLTS
jgi:hypothetical protein